MTALISNHCLAGNREAFICRVIFADWQVLLVLTLKLLTSHVTASWCWTLASCSVSCVSSSCLTSVAGIYVPYSNTHSPLNSQLTVIQERNQLSTSSSARLLWVNIFLTFMSYITTILKKTMHEKLEKLSVPGDRLIHCCRRQSVKSVVQSAGSAARRQTSTVYSIPHFYTAKWHKATFS